MFQRPSLTLAVLSVAMIGLAACSDNSPMPAAPNAPEATTSALRPKGPHMTIATTSVTTAVLYPTIDNVYVSAEGHRLYIPANSICNPVTSGYGPAFWNLPCAAATAPIVFTITSRVDANGRARIDVFPDVRFSPSKTVYAEFNDQRAATAFAALIAYCPTGSLTCIDESKADPSLRTVRDPASGKVYRRIKHFSGYNVILGMECEVGSDPNCVEWNGNGFGF